MEKKSNLNVWPKPLYTVQKALIYLKHKRRFGPSHGLPKYNFPCVALKQSGGILILEKDWESLT